jgi:hypothetical protein
MGFLHTTAPVPDPTGPVCEKRCLPLFRFEHMHTDAATLMHLELREQMLFRSMNTCSRPVKDNEDQAGRHKVLTVYRVDHTLLKMATSLSRRPPVPCALSNMKGDYHELTSTAAKTTPIALSLGAHSARTDHRQGERHPIAIQCNFSTCVGKPSESGGMAQDPFQDGFPQNGMLQGDPPQHDLGRSSMRHATKHPRQPSKNNP